MIVGLRITIRHRGSSYVIIKRRSWVDFGLWEDWIKGKPGIHVVLDWIEGRR